MTPGYERDIRPLFRAKDVQAMRFAFDLHGYADTRAHAAEILERVDSGSMPCDTLWPAEDVELLRRWIDGGMPP